MGKLEGKVAIITGGTSGIGGASAKLFAEEGAKVIACGRSIERGEQFEAQAKAEGLSIEFFRCDVTSKDDIATLYEYLINNYGKLDILFNNAGLLITAALDEIKDDDWDAMYEANVKSVMHMCQTFVEMLRESHGVILNNASINGLQHYVKGVRSYMYASSKAALIQFTNYMAKNYSPEIRVNALCPGITVTNLFTNRDFSRFEGMNLLGRMADPKEIANVALFLCSDDASFVTGSVIVADGGETIK